jgi:hypothetical protein
MNLIETMIQGAMHRLMAESERRLIEICDRHGWPTTPEYIHAHMGIQPIPATEPGEISRQRYFHDGDWFLEIRVTSHGNLEKLIFKQEFIQP